MATNIKAVEWPDHDGDTVAAYRQSWINATNIGAEGEPIGAKGGFANQQKARYKPAPDKTTRREPDGVARSTLRLALYAVGAVVVVILLYLLISSAVAWASVRLDDLRYGYPRTTQIDAFVGHAGEESGTPSHFIALNLNRQITIIEMPGGDAQKATTISGPYLFGATSDLTPATLRVQDINGDNKPDLLVSVNDEQLALINEPDKNTFRLMTPEEHAALLSAARGGSNPTLDGGSH